MSSLGRLYPPPIVSKSTGASMSTLPTTPSTPNNEEELEAARDVLRAVITKHVPIKQLPGVPMKHMQSVSTQTDGVQLEGLIRAAGMSLSHFAAEIKSLERKLESQNLEILNEVRKMNFSQN